MKSRFRAHSETVIIIEHDHTANAEDINISIPDHYKAAYSALLKISDVAAADIFRNLAAIADATHSVTAIADMNFKGIFVSHQLTEFKKVNSLFDTDRTKKNPEEWHGWADTILELE